MNQSWSVNPVRPKFQDVETCSSLLSPLSSRRRRSRPFGVMPCVIALLEPRVLLDGEGEGYSGAGEYIGGGAVANPDSATCSPSGLGFVAIDVLANDQTSGSAGITGLTSGGYGLTSVDVNGAVHYELYIVTESQYGNMVVEVNEALNDWQEEKRQKITQSYRNQDEALRDLKAFLVGENASAQFWVAASAASASGGAVAAYLGASEAVVAAYGIGSAIAAVVSEYSGSAYDDHEQYWTDAFTKLGLMMENEMIGLQTERQRFDDQLYLDLPNSVPLSTDTFTYQLDDYCGGGMSNSATVTVDISGGADFRSKINDLGLRMYFDVEPMLDPYYLVPTVKQAYCQALIALSAWVGDEVHLVPAHTLDIDPNGGTQHFDQHWEADGSWQAWWFNTEDICDELDAEQYLFIY